MQNSEFEYLLKHGQESLEFALQSGRMGTWDVNLETKKVSCSQVMLDLWGLSSDELSVKRSVLQQKVHPEDLDKMNAAIDSAIRNNTIYEIEYRIIPSPGIERWILSRGRCTFTDNSKLPSRFSGVVYEITERKQKEAELAKAVSARDEFFMIASHELRTPLTSLQLQIQVAEWELKHDYPDAFTVEKIQASLKKQKEQLLRITRIVDNILDETKINQGKLQLHYEHVDLSDMVVDVLSRFKVMANASQVETALTQILEFLENGIAYSLSKSYLTF